MDELRDGVAVYPVPGDNVTNLYKVGRDVDAPAVDVEMAVVDQHGKVHGLQNIRVADASIMPDCIRANTNATTIMIAEKISDYVIQDR